MHQQVQEMSKGINDIAKKNMNELKKTLTEKMSLTLQENIIGNE